MMYAEEPSCAPGDAQDVTKESSHFIHVDGLKGKDKTYHSECDSWEEQKIKGTNMYLPLLYPRHVVSTQKIVSEMGNEPYELVPASIRIG